MVFSENIQSSTASNAKSLLKGSISLFHRLPANIWAFACSCNIRCCPAWERTHSCTSQSVGAEVRYDLFFWEFTVICEESERDYWIWTRWLFPAGRLADLGLLACTYYDDSVSLCWLTTHQAHWLPAGLQGWLPVWLLPLLNVLKTVGPATY